MYIQPLHHGENGSSETDIRVRGLSLLAINYQNLQRFHLYNLEELSPIYIVQKVWPNPDLGTKEYYRILVLDPG